MQDMSTHAFFSIFYLCLVWGLGADLCELREKEQPANILCVLRFISNKQSVFGAAGGEGTKNTNAAHKYEYKKFQRQRHNLQQTAQGPGQTVMAVIDIYLDYGDHHNKKGPAIVCIPPRYGPERFVCSARAGMEQLQDRAKPCLQHGRRAPKTCYKISLYVAEDLDCERR